VLVERFDLCGMIRFALRNRALKLGDLGLASVKR